MEKLDSIQSSLAYYAYKNVSDLEGNNNKSET